VDWPVFRLIKNSKEASMDLMTQILAVIKAVADGSPLVVLIFALVALAKRSGVEGHWLLVISLTLGLVLGGGYMISLEMPSTFAGWFTAAVVGLAYGAFTSLSYDGLRDMIAKAQNPKKTTGKG
jgi:hypothetical protein